MPTITYMMPKSFDITEAEHELIMDLNRNDKKVTAVKFMKKQYGLDLANAKHLVDSIGKEPNRTY